MIGDVDYVHKGYDTRNQRTNESFSAYLVDLSNKADACELGEKKLEFIRDRIVVGIASETVRKILLIEPDLTLDKAIEICQLHELAESDSRAGKSRPGYKCAKTEEDIQETIQTIAEVKM